MKTKTLLFILISLIVLLLPWGLDCFRPAWKVTNTAPGIAILLGVLCTAAIGAPLQKVTSKAVPWMLGSIIVGMGFSMNLIKILQTGGVAFLYTAIGITMTLALGLWLGKRLKLESNTSILISVGTAICGGSAIAAAAPAIKAKAYEIALATATIFVLNGLALILFPILGNMLDFSQAQFGTWAALAIHDTSSVVGATMAYGDEAWGIGVTVKLLRALWIIPVTLCLSLWVGAHSTEEKSKRKLNVPWFIPGFLIAAALVTFLPMVLPDCCDAAIATISKLIKSIAKYVLILALFWVGANISLDKVKAMGIRPLVQGVILWVIIASVWCAVLLWSGLPYPGQS